MTWTQRGLILYPVNVLSVAHKDALARAFVETVSLETFANERLMFDKAARYSGDFGATETHAAIHTALTPELADAIRAALVGVSGLWYILDADTGALLDTNDAAKLDAGEVAHGLDWQPGNGVAASEVLRYNATLYAVIQAHTTQADWPPDVARSLFMRYRAPGEVSAWEQPLGSFDTYPLGARVLHNEHTWRSLIADNVWEPGAVGSESLWACEDCEQEPETPPAWAQPASAHDAYNTGDRVTFEGNIYESLIDANVWSPTAYPQGWQLIGPA